MVQYGTSEKANQAENGTPILRINNIKGGRIDAADLKYIPIQEKQKDALRLEDGDILIIRTSGSRDLVGTCAAFHEEGDFCFASYLIRLRVRKNRAISDFVAYFINSPLGRQQVDSMSRKIMQNNINSEEIRSLQIPLPPLPVQQEILRQIVEGLAEVSKIRGAVQEIASDSKREIETLILGTKKVDSREPTRLTS
jgi:type I restriction enzyme S subunit